MKKIVFNFVSCEIKWNTSLESVAFVYNLFVIWLTVITSDIAEEMSQYDPGC